jgi:hypothetical protein
VYIDHVDYINEFKGIEHLLFVDNIIEQLVPSKERRGVC